MKKDKKQKIIEATLKLFKNTHDVKQVSLENIAKSAKVSPTTIYNNFGNRENLVFEVIKTMTRQMLDRNTALVKSSLPFPQKLIGIMSNKMEMASEYDQELIEKMVSQDEMIVPFVNKIYEEEIKPLWKIILEEGKEQGYIDSGIDITALVIYLDVLKAGFATKPEIFDNFQDNVDMIKQLTNLMFHGFLIKEIDIFGKEGNNTNG